MHMLAALGSTELPDLMCDGENVGSDQPASVAVCGKPAIAHCKSAPSKKKRKVHMPRTASSKRVQRPAKVLNDTVRQPFPQVPERTVVPLDKSATTVPKPDTKRKVRFAVTVSHVPAMVRAALDGNKPVTRDPRLVPANQRIIQACATNTPRQVPNHGEETGPSVGCPTFTGEGREQAQ